MDAAAIKALKFDEKGLIPAVLQDWRDGTVLMVAYMNRESLQATLDTGHATYWSRSRKAFWVKGETSGHRQKVRAIHVDCDADTILQRVEEGAEKPKPKVLFEVGENVRVKDGPFTNFNGNVEDVNYDKSKIRVSVLIFGRPTPVELDFGQVEKV